MNINVTKHTIRSIAFMRDIELIWKQCEHINRT